MKRSSRNSEFADKSNIAALRAPSAPLRRAQLCEVGFPFPQPRPCITIRCGLHVIGIATLLLIMLACGGKRAQTHDVYTCPMHPTIIADHKGTCPVCDMDLVKKAGEGEGIAITEDLAKLLKSPNEVIVTETKTIKPEYRSGTTFIDAQGVVTYDTKKIFTIASRTTGRLEKVFLKYAYQPVSKGQKIAEIYSPELLTAVRELTYLQDHDPENTSLIEDAKNKLELLGLTASQIKEIPGKRQLSITIPIFSPYDGYLIGSENDMSPATGSPDDDDDKMSLAKSGTNAQPDNFGKPLLQEGDYVSAGQSLYKIVSDNAYRIELDLPASQASSVRVDEELVLDFLNGHTHTAQVDFVQPFFSNGQSFVKIRVYTTKMEGLHIGHLVKTRIQIKGKESVWIPRAAVVYLGNESVVFVKEKNVLKPRKVHPGSASEGFVEILKGLASSDEVAANAQFLVDSESFIKPNNK